MNMMNNEQEMVNSQGNELENLEEGEAEVYQELDSNLAFYMDSSDLDALSDEIWKKTEKEEDSFSEFQKKISFILELCGLDLPNQSTTSNRGGSAGDNYIKNSGTSGLYSSAMSETLFSVANTVTSTLFSNDPMVDASTHGPLSPNGQILDPAIIQDMTTRVKDFSDAWFKKVLKGFKSDLNTTIMWASLLGKAYRKVYFDAKRGFPRSSFIPPGMILTNETFNKFHEGREWTHKYFMTREEIQQKIDSKEWDQAILNAGAGEQDFEKDTSAIRERINSMQGRGTSESFNSDDGEEDLLPIYERHMDADIGRGFEPYIITYGKNGGIGCIDENFDPQDPLKLPIEYLVEYSFLPSFDGEGLGLANYAGQNARAATVLERRTIDAVIASSFPPAFIKPTAKFQNHTLNMEPGKITTLPTGDDDIGKAITFAPVSTPNPMMWQLKSDLEDAIKKVSLIVSQDMMELATRAPQGSVLAMLNRMEQLPNSILKSFYDSFCQELSIFKRMFYQWLPETNEPFIMDIEGETLKVFKNDFSPYVNIFPTGNFSSESTAYKFMRAEIILNQARQNPDVHNMRNVMMNFYKDMGLDEDIIAFLMPDPAQQQQQIVPLDPLTENSNLLTSKGAKSSLEQNHEAHMIIHQQILQSTQDPTALAATHAHIQEHQAMKMLVDLQAMSGVQLPPDPSQLPVEQQNQIAIQVAQALMQQQQQAAANGPQQPIDPGLVGLEEVKAQKEIAHLNADVKMKQIESEAHNAENKVMLEISKLELAKEKQEHEAMKAEFELRIKEQELQLAVKESELNHSHHEIDNLKKIVDMGKEEQVRVSEILHGDSE